VSAIGLAALACVGCCALPLLAAGSIVSGGLAVLHDSCLAPLAILLLVVLGCPQPSQAEFKPNPVGHPVSPTTLIRRLTSAEFAVVDGEPAPAAEP
jgi:hypothetical protein